MGSINRALDAGYSFRQSQPLGVGRRPPAVGEQTLPPYAKPNSDEAYLSSCRPTRLSMQLMLQARAQGK